MPPYLLVFGLFAVFMVIVVVMAHLAAERRMQELRGLAMQLGLQFVGAPGDIHRRYDGFEPFGMGSSQRSSNLLSGPAGELYWEIFEYRYTTGSGKNRHTHRYQIIAAHVPMDLPRLGMRREGVFDKFASMVGFDDINFESEQFSRLYHVQCSDRKAAYDLVHPRMIEYLLSIEPLRWQVGGPRVMLLAGGTCPATRIVQMMGLIESFIALIPEYVRQDRSMAPRGD